jgi:hypothetical protein
MNPGGETRIKQDWLDLNRQAPEPVERKAQAKEAIGQRVDAE